MSKGIKNPNVRNINTIGTIMKVILAIGKVLTIIGFICTIALSVLVMWLPVDDVTIRPTVHMDVEWDSDKLDEKLIDDTVDTEWDIEDIAVRWYVKETDKGNGRELLSIDGEAEEITGEQIKWFVFKKLIISAVYLAALFVALLFGGKLAKALEKCDTPFSDEVIKKLVNFGKSLIPLGVFSVFVSSVGIGIAAVILMLLLFVSLFKYGAELQKQADETL